LAEEKKPGLLKRIFSFGFGRKKKAEPEVDEAAAKEAEEAAAREAEAKAAEEQAAREEAERLAAEEAAAKEKAEKLEAERLKAEQEAAALKAAEEKARAEAEAREVAEQQAREAEEKAAAAREAKEQAAAEKEAAKAARLAEKEAEKAEKAAEKEKAKREAQEEKEAEEARLKAEQEAAEKEAADRQEAERLAAEEQAAEDEAARLAAEEKAAKEEAERLAAEEAEREEAERLAAEEAAREEAERLAAEQRAAKEEADRLAAEKEAAEQEAARLAAEAEAAASAPEPEPEEPEEEERKEGWFKRLRKGLSRSASNLTENITAVFTKKKLDEDTLQELEDILIQADLGVETAMNITDALSDQRYGKDVTDEEVRQIMAEEITKVLEPVAEPLELDLDHKPHVILVVGVNGSGKTTTIGKLSQKLHDGGYSTLLVAGDTFRAAAIEQLHIWGDRTHAPVMSRDHGADAAGLAFDAYAEAKAQGKDVMMMDTAGRLQNKKELMDELEKIIRVLKKQDEAAPHTVLLTLDATTGQNALNQVEIFKDVAGVNGLVMTKLDGTARGGILVAISARHKLPVYFVGVGEQVEDLEPFEAEVFAKAIAGIE